MTRAKLLAVLAGTIATLSVSAAPAFAEFQSNSSETKGAGKSGAVVLEGGGATLECASAEGTWTILSGGKPSTKGTQEQLNITTWKECFAKSSFINHVAATVKACTLELEQAAGSNKAKGSTVTTCTVEVKVLGTCIITVASGQKGLETNLVENIAETKNDKITAADTNITSKPNAACFGIKETKEAKEKAVVTNIGQKVV